MRRQVWVLALVACGGGSASLGEPRPEPGSEPEEVVELSVFSGGTGTLELEDGARVVVEDNQLTEPVLVRFERRTCAGVFRSSVFLSCDDHGHFRDGVCERLQERGQGGTSGGMAWR